MAKCPHSDFRRGQRILFTLKNGKRFVDKFIESKSGTIITRNHGRIRKSLIRSNIIYKGA